MHDGGVAEELLGALEQLKRGRLTEEDGHAAIARADAWLEGLGPRRNSPGFAEEYREVADALEQLRDRFGQVFRRRVLALKVRRALSRKHKYISKAAVFANVAAYADPRARDGTADPGYIQPARVPKPSVEVELVDQGWVQQPRINYRARVRDVWAIIVNGQRIAEGSRRYCMRQAHWALMCDPSGRLPAFETMTGLAKRRALHKARRDRRRRQMFNRAASIREWKNKVIAAGRAKRPMHGRHGNRKRKGLLRAGKYLGQDVKLVYGGRPIGTMSLQGATSPKGPWVDLTAPIL